MSITPLLPLHKVVPLFTLPDKYGTAYNLAKQRGREHLLLLIFREGIDPPIYLRGFAEHAADWRKLPARGIVVVPREEVAGALGASPFMILIDAANRIADRFLPNEARAGVFALDRYGDLYQQWLATDVAELPMAEDVGAWLQAISMQCSV